MRAIAPLCICSRGRGPSGKRFPLETRLRRPNREQLSLQLHNNWSALAVWIKNPAIEKAVGLQMQGARF